MVTKHRKLYSIVITLVCLAVLSSGITVSADGEPEEQKAGSPSRDRIFRRRASAMMSGRDSGIRQTPNFLSGHTGPLHE